MKQQIPLVDQEVLAAVRSARLRYVSDTEPGISRRRFGRGFAFYRPDGSHIRNTHERQRLKQLAIPPAWEAVWISPWDDGHLQATGRDAMERKQYLYHPRWTEIRSQWNFDRLLPFGEALPRLRGVVYRRLREPDIERETVLAAMVRLLDTTLIRIGNIRYARENDSYGLTTLRNRHLSRKLDYLRFTFTGKSGVKRDLRLYDPLLAELTDQLEDLPGSRLFQYRDANDQLQPVTARAVNEFIERHAGPFTAKNFRTWGGTVSLADALVQFDFSDDEAENRRHLQIATELAAERLGNTATVARSHYLHPAVGEAFLCGNLHRHFREGREIARNRARLKIAEGVVLSILRDAA